MALLGMMASGKSTIGRALGERLSVPFKDIDGELEERAGISIADYFDRHGEEVFRRLELETIREFLVMPSPFILSLGGGAFLQPEVRSALRDKAVTVYLKVKAEEIVRRLERTDISRRPVLALAPNWRQRAEELTASRGIVYAGADVVFDASGDDVGVMAERLAGILAGRDDLRDFFSGEKHA